MKRIIRYGDWVLYKEERCLVLDVLGSTTRIQHPKHKKALIVYTEELKLADG